MYLILTYFHQTFGPRLFFSFPDKYPDEEISQKIKSFMDLDLRGTSYEVNLVEEKLKTINHYIEIPSEWARGKKEMALISVLSEKNYKGEIFYDSLKGLTDKILSENNVYKGFYKNNEKYANDTDIDPAYEKLEQLFQEAHEKMKESLETSTMGSLLIIGLNKAGKTTIIERIKNNKFNPGIKPTLATSLLQLALEEYLFRVIDVSGQKRLRDKWFSITKVPDAIIFVVDLTDEQERMIEAKEEFIKAVSQYKDAGGSKISEKTPILILANKVDLLSEEENKDNIINNIHNLLELEGLDLKHKVYPTSAKTGEGVAEGFQWLVSRLMKVG